jgi:NAD(P)-dependent dehydrogenase (short-subunit alcohol dehydrogenase family)
MIDELFSLEGKTALVTGASSGLGHHFSKVLAEAGANVAVAARRKEKLESLAGEIRSNGGNAFAIQMDVTDNDSVMNAFNKIENEMGTIDILINNAGVAQAKFFLDLDEESWDYIMETNLKGAWRVAREMSKRLTDTEKPGCIVNISSLLGTATQSMQTAYAVSKAGLSHMTRSMANELIRFNIRVNALAPGYFESEMTEGFFSTEKGKQYLNSIPAKRLGRVDELTGPLLLLVSDAGSFMTGVVLPVDGGHLVASR